MRNQKKTVMQRLSADCTTHPQPATWRLKFTSFTWLGRGQCNL